MGVVVGTEWGVMRGATEISTNCENFSGSNKMWIKPNPFSKYLACLTQHIRSLNEQRISFAHGTL